MLVRSFRLAEAAKFIRRDEFLDALYRIWPEERSKSPTKLGMSLSIIDLSTFKLGKRYAYIHVALAISGGVDSMALAVMCKRYISHPADPQLEAFIVDHKLRELSSEEANTIKNICQVTLGMFYFPASRYQSLMRATRHTLHHLNTT
jgi:NH3-dependent NAD+ synthetase